MVAKLVVAKGKTSVKEIPLNADQTIIGRRSDCSLRIPSPLVSRQHCALKLQGERLLVKDLGSSNGTFVNGAKVKQRELQSGDTLGVGPITFIVQLGGAALSPADTARPGVAVAADDAADFVVEEAAAGDADDFVVDELPADDDAANFVVEEADGSGDELAFVVADETPSAKADDDFVLADESPDNATVHLSDSTPISEPDTEVWVPDAKADDGAVIEAEVMDAEAVEAEPVDAEAVDAEVAEEPEPGTKKKAGLFGRFFGTKEKPNKAAAKPEPAAPAPEPPKPAKSETKKPVAAPAAPAVAAPVAADAVPVADDDADFFVQDDDTAAKGSKAVGEDELADFLMGLNEKEQ